MLQRLCEGYVKGPSRIDEFWVSGLEGFYGFTALGSYWGLFGFLRASGFRVWGLGFTRPAGV